MKLSPRLWKSLQPLLSSRTIWREFVGWVRAWMALSTMYSRDSYYKSFPKGEKKTLWRGFLRRRIYFVRIFLSMNLGDRLRMVRKVIVTENWIDKIYMLERDIWTIMHDKLHEYGDSAARPANRKSLLLGDRKILLSKFFETSQEWNLLRAFRTTEHQFTQTHICNTKLDPIGSLADLALSLPCHIPSNSWVCSFWKICFCELSQLPPLLTTRPPAHRDP